jgi:hypothetical protein
MGKGGEHWRHYERKVWLHAWDRSRHAAQKLQSSLPHQVVTLLLTAAVVGTAVELRSFIPVIGACLVLLIGLATHLILAPMRLDRESQDKIDALQISNAELHSRLESNRLARERYELMRMLYMEGDVLVISGKKFSTVDPEAWEQAVADWRDRTYSALPTEKDAFLNIATPIQFKVAPHHERVKMLAVQINKLRLIMQRLEENVGENS